MKTLHAVASLPFSLLAASLAILPVSLPAVSPDAAGLRDSSLPATQQVASAQPKSLPSGTNCFAAPPDMVSWWPAEGSAADFVGPNSGVLSNGVLIVPGAVGHAFSFDGVDDWVIVPSSPSLNMGPGQDQFASSNAHVYINGGYLYMDANGDGLDSNGSIDMTNGTVIVNGPTNNGNGAIDYNGTFNLTGGYLDFKDLDGEELVGIYEMAVLALEKPLLTYIMDRAEGNQTRASEMLGINRNTLRKKLKQHGRSD